MFSLNALVMWSFKASLFLIENVSHLLRLLMGGRDGIFVGLAAVVIVVEIGAELKIQSKGLRGCEVW